MTFASLVVWYPFYKIIYYSTIHNDCVFVVQSLLSSSAALNCVPFFYMLPYEPNSMCVDVMDAAIIVGAEGCFGLIVCLHSAAAMLLTVRTHHGLQVWRILKVVV